MATGFLVVGEALVDIVHPADGPVTEHPGGSPANVALGLARLGRSARLLTRLGDDDHGRAVAAHLADSGVELVEGSVQPGPTSTATARLDAAGVARYEFALDWRLPGTPTPEAADPEAVDPDAAATDAAPADVAVVDVPVADVLHTGSLATVLEPGAGQVAALIRQLAAAGTTVSLDPNVRPALAGPGARALAAVEALLPHCDLVKVSDEDLSYLAPGHDPVQVARAWLELGPTLVVVTRGGQGAVAVSRGGHTVEVPGRPVAVVDTVGAGDSFTAGLLHSLAGQDLLGPGRRAALREITAEQLRTAVRDAVLISSITCTRAGANPPWRAELAAEPDLGDVGPAAAP